MKVAATPMQGAIFKSVTRLSDFVDSACINMLVAFPLADNASIVGVRVRFNDDLTTTYKQRNPFDRFWTSFGRAILHHLGLDDADIFTEPPNIDQLRKVYRADADTRLRKSRFGRHGCHGFVVVPVLGHGTAEFTVRIQQEVVNDKGKVERTSTDTSFSASIPNADGTGFKNSADALSSLGVACEAVARN